MREGLRAVNVLGMLVQALAGVDQLAKATTIPAGFEPAPGSRRGYYRKPVGQSWDYWHPRHGHVTPKSAQFVHADLITDRLQVMHERDVEAERARWGDQSAEGLRQRPARYTPSEVMDETGLPKRAALLGLEHAVALGQVQKREHMVTATRRIGLFGKAGYKRLDVPDHRYGPAPMADLSKGAQVALVHAEHRAPALHAATPSTESRCGTKVLLPARNGHGRRYQCVSRQRKVFHGEHARQLLHQLHRHGGEQPMTRTAVERRHVQDLHGEGLIELRRNPAHHVHEFTARLTSAGRRHVEKEKRARGEQNARRQGALFKAVMEKARTSALTSSGLHELLAGTARPPAATPAATPEPGGLAKGQRASRIWAALLTLRRGAPDGPLELAKASDASGADVVHSFQAGGFTCQVRRAVNGVLYLTLAHPRLPLPYHMIVRSEADAEQVARSAVPLLLAGRTPAEGVYRRVGPIPPAPSVA